VSLFMKLNYIIVCLMPLGFIGCEKPAPVERTKLITQNHIPVHRFVITRDSGLALDTQTGQLCRTWEWVPSGKQRLDADGNPIPRNYGEFTPTCLSVYEQYPSGKDSQTELIPDGTSNP
jgi:hypothetical protein